MLGPERQRREQDGHVHRPEGDDEIVIRTRQPEGFLLSDMSLAPTSLCPGNPTSARVRSSSMSDKPPIVLARIRWLSNRTTGNRCGEDFRIRDPAAGLGRHDARGSGRAARRQRRVVDFVEAESTVQTLLVPAGVLSSPRLQSHVCRCSRSRDVRRALNTAIDRQQIVDIGLRKRGIPSDGPIWPYHFGRSRRPARLRVRPGQGGGTAGRARPDPRTASISRAGCPAASGSPA